VLIDYMGACTTHHIFHMPQPGARYYTSLCHTLAVIASTDHHCVCAFLVCGTHLRL
jgi:hypothetical protein